MQFPSLSTASVGISSSQKLNPTCCVTKDSKYREPSDQLVARRCSVLNRMSMEDYYTELLYDRAVGNNY